MREARSGLWLAASCLALAGSCTTERGSAGEAGRAGENGAAPTAARDGRPRVRTPVAHDLSPPLRVLARRVGKPEPFEEEEEPVGAPARGRAAPVRDPLADDLAFSMLNPFSPLQNFEGISTAELNTAGLAVINFAADNSGAAGPNHYVQSVNFAYSIYDKTGTRLLGPTASSSFWNGFAGSCGGNWSDVVVLYDRVADRWFVSRFAQDAAKQWFQCFAISQTADPTGAYFRYAYLIDTVEFNDYPKFGVWPDAYYMTAQRDKIFPGKGLFVAAFERAKMLAGDGAAQMVLFSLDNGGNRAGMLPADWDGQLAPAAGAPNFLVRPLSADLGWSSDALEVWKFHVDWGTPAASTLTLADTLAPATYHPACGMNQNCIPQPGTATKLDPLASGYLMYRLAYRNFGDHEALVLNHTVDAGDLAPAVHGAVRWYELRRTGGAWSIFQQGTHAPDGDHRWIGSIAMDRAGSIALAYNVSGAARSPSIAYAGRLDGDPAGTLSDEVSIQEGGGSQTGFIFWSDYSQLTLDPTDDCTFWYVNSYQPSTSANQNWNTRIASFRAPACPRATTALVYTGAVTEDFHDPATLSATLLNTFNGLPLVGRPVTFAIGAQSCGGTTDATGHAACVIIPNVAAGAYPLTASFPGDAQLEPAAFAGSFLVTREETTVEYTGPTVIANGSSLSLSAILREDGVTAIAGRTLQFTLGSGATAQSCSGLSSATGVASCTIASVAQPLGAGQVTAAFAGDAFYLPSSDSAATVLFAFLDSGAFVVGDGSASGPVTFWAADWTARNVLSGGAGPPAFKGFAATLASTPPACGVGWSTAPGNSSKPPAAVPSYMGVLVATAVAKSGSAIAGDAPTIIVVKTDPGYSPNPGHAGTGTVVASFCP